MKNTEQKLKKLFDFQKFEQNQKLSNMIDEAESEGAMLSDEDLSFVNAAGEPGTLGTDNAEAGF